MTLTREEQRENRLAIKRIKERQKQRKRELLAYRIIGVTVAVTLVIVALAIIDIRCQM